MTGVAAPHSRCSQCTGTITLERLPIRIHTSTLTHRLTRRRIGTLASQKPSAQIRQVEIVKIARFSHLSYRAYGSRSAKDSVHAKLLKQTKPLQVIGRADRLALEQDGRGTTQEWPVHTITVTDNPSDICR